MPLADSGDAASRGRPGYGSSLGGFQTQQPFLQRFHSVTEHIDDALGRIAGPLKPYLPAIGRMFIVATFLEDAFRIVTQWGDQLNYISNARGVPYFLAVLFLLLNVISMLVGSFSVISRKRLEVGVGALIFVVISQALVYGLLFNLSFFFRNLSLLGGLFMALSDAYVRDKRSLSLPGLPVLEDKDKSKYLLLTGRILLIFLFLTYLMTKKWSLLSGMFNILGLVACSLVVIGYKARLSAAVLVVMLSIQNLIKNPYWRYAASHPSRDFLRYEHFQTLSIVGGLILVASAGAGKISIDEKKKIY